MMNTLQLRHPFLYQNLRIAIPPETYAYPPPITPSPPPLNFVFNYDQMNYPRFLSEEMTVKHQQPQKHVAENNVPPQVDPKKLKFSIDSILEYKTNKFSPAGSCIFFGNSWDEKVSSSSNEDVPVISDVYPDSSDSGNAAKKLKTDVEPSQQFVSSHPKSKMTASNGNNRKSSPYDLKPKRARTIFSPDQMERLEFEFERQQYMVGQERSFLASVLNLTESQVKIWFQNRRIKWRKQNQEMLKSRLEEMEKKEV